MATLTWVAAAAGLASDGLNWSGGVAPQNGDVVVFDGTSVNNCSWDLDASVVTVNSLTLATGYAGTVTQGDVDIGIGAGGFLQEDGVFTGRLSKNIIISGNYIRVGGGHSLNNQNLVMTGDGTYISKTGSNALVINTLKVSANIELRNTLSINTFEIDAGKKLTLNHSGESRCQMWTGKWINNGIVEGPGTIQLRLYTSSVIVHMGIINAPVKITGIVTADRVISIDSDSFVSSLIITSESATNTITLDTAGHSLTAASVTVGTRGNILWGEGTHRIGSLDTSAGGSDFETSQVIMTGWGNIKLGAGQAFHDLEFEAPVTLASNVAVGGYLYFPKYINYNGYSVTVDPANIVEAIPIATFERDGIKVTKGQFDSVAATSLAVNGADFATKAAIWDAKQDAFANATALNAVSGTNTGDETQGSIKSKLGAATSSADGYMTAAQVTALNGKQNALSGDVSGHYHSADRNLSSLNMDGDKDFLGVAINNPGPVDGVDVGSHAHSGATGQGAKINFANVNISGNKNFGLNELYNVKKLGINHPGIESALVFIDTKGTDPIAINDVNQTPLFRIGDSVRTLMYKGSGDFRDNIIVGGTVDGVDISEHTHDGTAWGGKKIAWVNIDISAGIKANGHSISGAYDVTGSNKCDFKRGYNVNGIEVISPERNIKNVSSITSNGAITGASVSASGAITQNNGMPVASCPVPGHKQFSFSHDNGEGNSKLHGTIIPPSGRTGLAVSSLILNKTGGDCNTVLKLTFDDNTTADAIIATAISMENQDVLQNYYSSLGDKTAKAYVKKFEFFTTELRSNSTTGTLKIGYLVF